MASEQALALSSSAHISVREQDVDTPIAYAGLWRPARHKVWWGGRGAAKSWQVGRYELVKAATIPDWNVLCAREYQNSIADSVHAVLKSQIRKFNVGEYFQITDYTIRSHKGGAFVYTGLHNNIDQVKSKEGIKSCWVEEAHDTSDESWKYLLPTIREDGSEIVITFNQHDDVDPTYSRFVTNTPYNSIVHPVTWEDNPHFGPVLEAERAYHESNDPDSYDWVWGVECRKIGSAIIFLNKFKVEAFEEPLHGVRPRYGLDFGFANDPNACIRFYTTTERDGDHLWITHEAVAHSVELDDLPAFLTGGKSQDGDREWEGIPDVTRWPILADGARPETISYLRRKGFSIRAADKWPGSVEDGLAHLKRYRWIHIHQRCKNMAREARLYAYKQDPKTGDVMPVILDKNNHCWDAVRYGHDGEIQHSGGLGVWAKLSKPSHTR